MRNCIDLEYALNRIREYFWQEIIASTVQTLWQDKGLTAILPTAIHSCTDFEHVHTAVPCFWWWLLYTQQREHSTVGYSYISSKPVYLTVIGLKGEGGEGGQRKRDVPNPAVLQPDTKIETKARQIDWRCADYVNLAVRRESNATRRNNSAGTKCPTPTQRDIFAMLYPIFSSLFPSVFFCNAFVS